MYDNISRKKIRRITLNRAVFMNQLIQDQIIAHDKRAHTHVISAVIVCVCVCMGMDNAQNQSSKYICRGVHIKLLKTPKSKYY